MIDIIRKEIDGSHYYWVDGEYYPGVTSIIEAGAPTPYALKKWFKETTLEEQDEKSKTSLAFGSLIHDVAQKLLSGVEINLETDYPQLRAKKHIVALANWLNDVKPTIIDTEQTVASKKYKYAGTLDALVKIGGKTFIVDFKTSAGIYESYHLQLSAYKQAVEEMGLAKDVGTMIVRTGTKHKRWYEAVETEATIEDFQRIYDTYLWLNKGKIPEPPNMDVYPTVLSYTGSEVVWK